MHTNFEKKPSQAKNLEKKKKTSTTSLVQQQSNRPEVKNVETRNNNLKGK